MSTKEKITNNVKSPLRYPGGKRKLYTVLLGRVRESQADTFVELFAGGAGLGLSYLINGDVEKLWLNDSDNGVYCFWAALLNDPFKFADAVLKIPLTLEERENQINNLKYSSDEFDVGFAFFYLNRVNYSGVIRAGVLGGNSQSGSVNIASRFNRTALSESMLRIGEYKDDIHITNFDGVQLISDLGEASNLFLYLDPPYFKKGKECYSTYMTEVEHTKLRDALKQEPLCSNKNWILSYDNCPEIRELYKDFNIEYTWLKYSMNSKRDETELLISAGYEGETNE